MMSKKDEALEMAITMLEGLNIVYLKDVRETNQLKINTNVAIETCKKALEENKEPTQIWAMEDILNRAGFYKKEPQPKEPTHVVQFTDEQLEQIQKAIKYASDNPITQPKEPQYLYVYLDDNYELSTIPLDNDRWKYIGKIQLEVENE